MLIKQGGNPTGRSSWNSHLSVHQEKPPPAEWRLWRRACLLWSDINAKLPKPLGKWMVPPASQRQRQFAYVHLNHLWIWQEDIKPYREYCRYEGDEGFHALQRAIHINEIPDQAIPAKVMQISAADVWTASETPRREHAVTRSTRLPRTTFADYVKTLSLWEQSLLQYSEFVSTPFDFCTDLQPSLRAVSDGSVRHEKLGAFGWSMRNERGNTVVTGGMGPVHGGGRVTSYQAEAYSMLSLLRFLICPMAEFADIRGRG